MASRKRPRENASVTETRIAWTLPADLMLEIVARSELRAIVRWAAACKPLRHDILHPSFIRRVSRQAPYILFHLLAFILVHPATSHAASFCDNHLLPFMLRHGDDLFRKYRVLVSRRGLVLLRRLMTKDRLEYDSSFELCVYDPMSGARTFLSEPLEIHSSDKYVLLTAADGIDCSFLVLVARFYPWRIRIQTASSCGTWGPVTYVHDRNLQCYPLQNHCNPAVLHGGIIHWLMEHQSKNILSYDVGVGKAGLVKLPPINYGVNNQLCLVTSTDGKVLKLLAIERFMMSLLRLPVSEAGGSDWSLEAVIDLEEKLRSLFPDIADGLDEPIQFNGSGKRNGKVVFLQVRRHYNWDAFVVFDLETREMYRQKPEFSLLEIDLMSRLKSMKIFS